MLEAKSPAYSYKEPNPMNADKLVYGYEPIT